mgnify:CR=1 FL=1|jgi:hypothetical protein
MKLDQIIDRVLAREGEKLPRAAATAEKRPIQRKVRLRRDVFRIRRRDHGGERQLPRHPALRQAEGLRSPAFAGR